MEIKDGFKNLRELKNILKKDVDIEKSRSVYSRMESGKANVTTTDLTNFLQALNLTRDEFTAFVDFDEPHKIFGNLLIKCVDGTCTSSEKKMLLNYYSSNPVIENLSKEEIYYYVAMTVCFYGSWKEIQPFTSSDSKKILLILLSEWYYTEYDYLIALHLSVTLNTDDLITMLNQMYPIELLEKRNEQTIKTSNLLLTNSISLLIYKMEYQIAYDYIIVAEKSIVTQKNYYVKLLLIFNKNIVLRFLKEDTKYIEQARKIIAIVKQLDDYSLAKALEIELNNLMTRADYYLESSKFPTVTSRS